jgi:Secretion system C-terminal sorting domain
MVSPLRNFYNTEPAKFMMHVIISINIDEPLNSAPEPLNNILDFDADASCYVTQNLNFIDADGDSLAYAITPFYAKAFDETYYVTPEATDSIGIDETGDFYWRNAIYYGRYALQFEVSEYRDGNLLGTSMYKTLYYLNCGVLDVSDNQKLSLTVYPNPAAESIYISNPNTWVIAYSICDGTGKQVAVCNNMSGTAPVDIRGLVPGMYSLQIEQNGVCNSTRFIKM